MEPAKGYKCTVSVSFTPVGEYTNVGSFTKVFTVFRGNPIASEVQFQFDKTLDAYVESHDELKLNQVIEPTTVDDGEASF